MTKYISEHKTIYVHCYAGAHRSPIITYCYLKALFGAEEAFKMFKDEIPWLSDKKNWLEEVLINDINAGRIPEDIIEFIRDVIVNKESGLAWNLKQRNTFKLPSKPKVTERKPVTEKQLYEENNH